MGAFQNSVTTFNSVTVVASLTRPANQTAYAAGDVVSAGTTNDHFTFKWTTSQLKSPFSGLISGAIITDSVTTGNLPDLELWLFHTDIAKVADNSAFAISDTEMLTCIGVIDFPVADWKTGGANSICTRENLGLAFNAPTSTIYGQLVIRNVYTPPADSEIITCRLVIAKDTG
jgi:hypothetical protein